MKLAHLEEVNLLNKELGLVRKARALFSPGRHRPYNCELCASVSLSWRERDTDSLERGVAEFPMTSRATEAYLVVRESEIIDRLKELGVLA